MPTSEARILANKANAARSTGPKTDEGKARSRENSLKHGKTGEGIVLTAADASEVARLERSFEAELKPSGDMGRILVRRMAVMSVRMDRGVAQESASLAERVRRAEADFDAAWPEGDGEGGPDSDRDRARVQAAHLALFDPSKEATLARKYEAAAERGFFRAMKELRLLGRQAKAAVASPMVGEAEAALGSFLRAKSVLDELAEVTPKPAPRPPVPASNPRPKPVSSVSSVLGSTAKPIGGAFELPFSIGRVV